MTTLKRFLEMVTFIASLYPKYKLGCIGSNGYCDCIGLIMGALARCGIKWKGIHGSNYAARYRLRGGISPVKDASELTVGELVFKGTTDTKDLPNRYKKGGALYNGDLHDYYHVGVVMSVNPLQIMHMTSPTVKVDTKLGKWGFHGKCSLIEYGAAPAPVPIIPNQHAIVTALSGKTVNLRKGKGKKYSIIERVPIGDEVEVLSAGDDWCKVRHDRYAGYMMTEFLREEVAA